MSGRYSSCIDQPVDAHRLATALDVCFARFTQHEAAVDRARDFGRDEDLAGLRERLDALGDVHGIAR